MTDRVLGFTVVLRTDLRDDDPHVASLTTAMLSLSGVAAVEPVIADANDALVRLRLLGEVRDGLAEKFRELLAELADA